MTDQTKALPKPSEWLDGCLVGFSVGFSVSGLGVVLIMHVYEGLVAHLLGMIQ